MATSHHTIRDQNMNLLYNGGTTPSSKTNFRKADEKSGVRRKALNDISNSRNPFMAHTGKKTISANVTSVDKDSYIAKTKRSRVPEKKGNGGRKPLANVTNSVDPCLHQAQKTVLKPKPVSEEKDATSILDEGFLHNHKQCIKSQTQILDKEYFLSAVELNNKGISNQCFVKSSVSSSMKESKSNPMIDMKIEPILEIPLDDHPSCTSPTCKSPNSPAPLGLMNWDDDDCLLQSHTPKLY